MNNSWRTSGRFCAAAAAALALAAGSTLGEEPRTAVAVIDMETVLMKYYKTKPADDEIQKQKREFGVELERMQREMSKLEEAFETARGQTHEKGLAEPALKEKLDAAEKKLLDVKEYELKIRQFAERRKREMVEESARMRDKLLKEIRAAVREYAEKNRLAAVLDVRVSADLTDRVVYYAATADITDKILAVLNAGRETTKEDSGVEQQ